MDLDTAKKIINSPAVQKYISQIDADAEAALEEMESTLSGMSDYPTHFITEYKADGKAMDDAWGDFNAEWNKIVFGKAKDGKAAMAAYKKYVITLCVLEEQNVRFGAYVEADVATFAATFIAFLIEFIKHLKAKCKALYDELTELQALLTKAKSEVTEAEIQRAVNVAITAVSLCLPAVGLGAGIAIAVGTFTVQTVLDASLGPGKPGVVGTLNTAAGDAIGVPKQIKPKFAKLGGAASGLYTLKLDTEEVEEAKKIVQAVIEKMRGVEKTIKMLEPFLDNDAEKLSKMQTAFENALNTAKAQEGKYKSAESRRLGLLKELAPLK